MSKPARFMLGAFSPILIFAAIAAVDADWRAALPLVLAWLLLSWMGRSVLLGNIH